MQLICSWVQLTSTQLRQIDAAANEPRGSDAEPDDVPTIAERRDRMLSGGQHSRSYIAAVAALVQTYELVYMHRDAFIENNVKLRDYECFHIVGRISGQHY